MYLFLRRVELTGLARGIVAALGAYVLFRLFYPMLRGLFPGGGERTLLWHVTPDTLVLGREEIPRGAIKAVHCWPNRDALGHAGAGWTVNIETTRKNHLLRSLTEGEGLDQSVRQLPHAAAERGNQCRRRLQTVRFLQPQPRRVFNPCFALAERGEARNDRDQIGNRPGIQRNSVQRAAPHGDSLSGNGQLRAEAR